MVFDMSSRNESILVRLIWKNLKSKLHEVAQQRNSVDAPRSIAVFHIQSVLDCTGRALALH